MTFTRDPAKPRGSSYNPFTVADLALKKCSGPSCENHDHAGKPLVLAGRCHPGRGVVVVYHESVMHIRCAVCDSDVVAVEVAP